MFFNNDNNLILLFITMTLLTVIFIFFLIGSMIRLKSRQVKREEELLLALIEERERTMNTISAEIHDNINQVLSLARMSVRMIEKTALQEQQQYIAECGSILDMAIGDLRNISHSLNATYLKNRGLIESLQEEIKWINLSKSIHCTLNVEGHFIPMAEDTELMVIRIGQEAIQNVVKHSKAQHLWIEIEYGKSSFTMSISDDGTGFETEAEAPYSSGMGLQSMQERCKMIKGDIDISSVKGLGTKIVLRLNDPQKVRLPA